MKHSIGKSNWVKKSNYVKKWENANGTCMKVNCLKSRDTNIIGNKIRFYTKE